MLFDINRDEQPAAKRPTERASATTAAGEAAVPQWVAEVFTTEVFALQKDIVGRAYPGDDVIGRMLAALESRGGTLTKAALARAISYPLFRMQGLLSNAQRVLNVDGYPVIAVDAESDTVVLDQQVLLVQFGLAGRTEGGR